MKFFSNRWSSTPIGRSFLDDAEYIHRSRWSQNLSAGTLALSQSVLAAPDVVELARKRLPIGAGTQALQDVNLIGVRTNQDSRFTALHATKNARGGLLGRSPEEPLKLGRFLLESRPSHSGSDARPAGNRSPDSSRVHARYTDGRVSQFMPQTLRKSSHSKLAGGIRRLARRGNQSEHARKVNDVGTLFSLQQRQKILDAVHCAPEIDVHQPAKVIERDLLKRAFQSDSCIVDQQRYACVPPADFLCKRPHALLIGDIHHVCAHQRAGFR